MSDLLRMTGMYSGMDTESIVSQLVKAKSTKLEKLKKEQTKHEWKQEAWQDMNSKIYNLYNKTLLNLSLQGNYQKRTTVCSDVTKATVVSNDGATNGTQTLKINKLAKSGYMTGAKLAPNKVKVKETQKDADGNEIEVEVEKNVDWTSSDKLASINKDLVGKSITIKTGTGDNEQSTEIMIEASTSISEFVTKLREAGVNASFDEKNQRFFISSKETGASNKFEVIGDDADLLALGIKAGENGCVAIDAQDAEIELNGATFTSSSNTISVNGLSINALGVTDEEITIVTSTNYDGVYDMIKDFISEYNELVNDMSKKYGADSASKYDVLSSEEKQAMTEEEVENWEGKIKDSLLRRDSDLYKVMSTMTGLMTQGFEINGKTMYMSNFGIGTKNYFEAKDGERYALHIDGDPDDEGFADKQDKLKKALAEDPDGTSKFFSTVAKTMYDKLYELMGSTDYSSIYKVYNDKQMKKEYDDYTKRIAAAQKELNAYEDKWYDKFSAMEVAMSKMQSKSNAVLGMLGNN